MRRELAKKLSRAVSRLVAEGRLPSAEYPGVVVEDTKGPEHGDFACAFALMAAKKAGLKPREIGEALAGGLRGDPDFEKVEVAGPGFVNLTLAPGCTARVLAEVLGDPSGFYRSVPERPLKINVEFVSVNPNGPITIGSGRGAAYGSTLCNVLEAAGHRVHREYYINDGVNSEQMRLFAESVKAILEGRPVPENGYKGDYVQEVAAGIRKDFVDSDPSVLSRLDLLQVAAQMEMLHKQAHDLAAFGVEFDTWFSEQSLHDSGAVEAEINHLVSTGAADDEERRAKVKFGKGGGIEDVEVEVQAGEEEDTDTPTLTQGGGNAETSTPPPSPPTPSPPEGRGGSATLWLRSTKFGDDMDRVLRRRDGRLTYIASDVAYHKDKFNRPAGADKLITVLGPDHHGYIGRLHAVVAADLLGEGRGPKVYGQGGGASSVGRQAPGTNPSPPAPSPPEGRGDDTTLGPSSSTPSPYPLPRPGEGWTENDAKVWRDAGEKQACLEALAKSREKLEVLIFQLVRFVKDGMPAPMRKRDGNVYALIDLINEIGERVQPDGSTEEKQRVGRDVARFFYLMRSHDTTFDFDLDLAERQSEDNPVFYAQYAHARICGVVEKAREAGIEPPVSFDGAQDDGRLSLLAHPKEKALILKLQDLGFEVERCGEDYAVNRLATYSVELARTYHHFYDACRVIQADQPELSRARLALCLATRASLRACFGLLGISAPEKM